MEDKLSSQVTKLEAKDKSDKEDTDTPKLPDGELGMNLSTSKEETKSTIEDDSKDLSAKSEEVVEEAVEKASGIQREEAETILSSRSLVSSNPSLIDDKEKPLLKSASSPSAQTSKEKHLERNQSDILPSLRELPPDEDASLMIFSQKGLPTKKFFRRKEVTSSILPLGSNNIEEPPTNQRTSPRNRKRAELTPKISQTIPKLTSTPERREKHPLSDRNPNVPVKINPINSRNVLTGFGVSSQDEFKGRCTRRRDGNPLLGTGYEEPLATDNTGRVPPGGFSSGLW